MFFHPIFCVLLAPPSFCFFPKLTGEQKQKHTQARVCVHVHTNIHKSVCFPIQDLSL